MLNSESVLLLGALALDVFWKRTWGLSAARAYEEVPDAHALSVDIFRGEPVQASE